MKFISENDIIKTKHYLQWYNAALNENISLNKTALDIAIEKINFEIIELLIKKGAKIKEKESLKSPVDHTFLIAVKTESLTIIKLIASAL